MIALESHDLPLGQAACTPVRLKHLFAISEDTILFQATFLHVFPFL